MKFSFDVTRELIERRKPAASSRAWLPGELIQSMKDANEIAALQLMNGMANVIYTSMPVDHCRDFNNRYVPPIAFAHAQEAGTYGQTIRIHLGDHDK
jgi:hypothetical protein